MLSASALAAAAPRQSDPSWTPSSADFRKLDLNRDGYISREEAARQSDEFAAVFAEADENHDGRLDQDEFIKAQAIYERARASAYVEDSMITARIKAALVKDPEVKSLGVSVETHRGTVQLSGFVDNNKQARRAAEIASGVRGVISVRNGLLIN